jgi:acetyltransferase
VKDDRPEESLPAKWTADDGTAMTLRPIRAEDADMLMSFVQGLSYGARYFRFGHGGIDFSEDEILRVCTPDPQECIHLLVLGFEGESEKIVGSGRVVFEVDGKICELALVVNDSWQRHGVGGRLLVALIESARRRGYTEMRAHVLATNRTMIDFLHHRGFGISDSPDGAHQKLATISL